MTGRVLPLPRFDRLPIRARLTITFAAVMTVLLAATGTFVYAQMRSDLDAQINSAVAAESNNSPDTAALWARADRTATDQAPAVPLTTTSDIHLVSARIGNYQYSFQQGALLDQLWVQ